MEEGILQNDNVDDDDTSSSTATAMDDTDKNLEPLEISPPGKASTRFGNVSVFQLDHKSGDPEGLDIIFSSLLFMIDTAKESLDLYFGYFQLFEELDAALTRAAQRGVKIRLVTNSSGTNGLTYLNNLFCPALERLLELGAKIYTTRKCDEGKICFHNKDVIADSRVALFGSWNCIGTSIFYDSDFSVLLFDENGGVFTPYRQKIDDLIKVDRLLRVTEVSGFDVPLFYKIFGNRTVMRRGF